MNKRICEFCPCFYACCSFCSAGPLVPDAFSFAAGIRACEHAGHWPLALELLHSSALKRMRTNEKSTSPTSLQKNAIFFRKTHKKTHREKLEEMENQKFSQDLKNPLKIPVGLSKYFFGLASCSIEICLFETHCSCIGGLKTARISSGIATDRMWSCQVGFHGVKYCKLRDLPMSEKKKTWSEKCCEFNMLQVSLNPTPPGLVGFTEILLPLKPPEMT